MKNKLILIPLLVIFIIVNSCVQVKEKEIDNCEYVVAYSIYGVSIIHKQNCKYCKLRENEK